MNVHNCANVTGLQALSGNIARQHYAIVFFDHSDTTQTWRSVTPYRSMRACHGNRRTGWHQSLENAAHAEAEPLQAVVELEPLPRFTWRYSAVIDHAPFNPISVPTPAAHPVLLKFWPPLNEAVDLVAPAGV